MPEEQPHSGNTAPSMAELLGKRSNRQQSKILSPLQIVVPITETMSRIIAAPNNQLASSNIWAGLVAGFSSHEFAECGATRKREFANGARTFIEWLAQGKNIDLRCAQMLAHFTEYELSILGHRRNSTAVVISKLFRLGYQNQSASFSPEQRHTVLTLSARQRFHGTKTTRPSLADWFLNIHWLRGEMEAAGFEELYLKLESPKMVKSSFELFCITLLGEIDSFRDYCVAIKEPNLKDLTRDVPYRHGKRTTKELRDQIRDQSSWFAPIISRLDLHSPIAEFFFAKHYGQEAQLAIAKFRDRADGTLPMRLYRNGKEHHAQHPSVFSRYNLIVPSAIEQFLVINLLAMTAIQPEFLGQLTFKNVLIQPDSRGRPLGVQFRYNKRRANHNQKETEIFSARSSIGRILLAYIGRVRHCQHLLDESDKGFLLPIFRTKNGSLRLTRPARGTAVAVPNLIVYWLQQPATYDKLCARYRNSKVSRVFLESFLVMMRQCEYSTPKARDLSDAQRAKAKVLPECIWPYSSLKQLGVFARSDQYRVGDLRNVNSHTSETERLSYLTDFNKDWVNRHGRVTRLVIDDMKRHVFNYDIHAVHRKSYERSLRTSIVLALDCDIAEEDVFVAPVNPENLEATGHYSASDGNNIFVLDHPATVIYLLHYLQQAETNSVALALNAPDFLEQTVAPRCEWMECLLIEKLSPASVERGSKIYETVKSRLPPLFSQKLRVG